MRNISNNLTVIHEVFVCYATPPEHRTSPLPTGQDPLILDTLHLLHQTFRFLPHGWVISLIFFRNSPAIIFSMNNQITLCSYYAQLSAVLRRQLCTIVYTYAHTLLTHTIVNNVFSTMVPSYVTQGQGITKCCYNCQCYLAISSYISKVTFQEAINILTGTKYQGIDGYFCDNVAHPEIL